MGENSVNPYEAVQVTKVRRNGDTRFFKHFLVALFSFFLAFWAGAIALFACVVLHEQGVF